MKILNNHLKKIDFLQVAKNFYQCILFDKDLIRSGGMWHDWVNNFNNSKVIEMKSATSSPASLEKPLIQKCHI